MFIILISLNLWIHSDRVYDDGSIRAKYYAEARREDIFGRHNKGFNQRWRNKEWPNTEKYQNELTGASISSH